MLPKNKIEDYVFDKRTHEVLYKISKDGIIDSIDSTIASGKEAVTFLGHSKSVPLVAKIYKIETSNFHNMESYIVGDYRFKDVPKNKRDLFLIWASKEYRNLIISLKNGVSCPIVIAKRENILIMSFIGEDEIPFPKLNEIKFDFEKVYPQIIDNYARMLYLAKIVHADFSAFNILIDPRTQKITIIDMGQAVIHSHPKSKEFLKRDIKNITNFLKKRFKNIDITYDIVLEDLKKKKLEFYGRNNKSRL
jgi:RIO kinase 1